MSFIEQPNTIIFKAKELLSFPNEVINNSNFITTLNLSLNYITEIPNVSFERLNVLALLGNKISFISEKQTKLFPKLHKLDVSQNLLSDVSSLINLTYLSHLDLSQNSITDITPLIHLENLEFLSLSVNHIHSLPDGFTKLRKLKTLDIDHNFFETIPTTICECPLQSINLNGNFIKKIPIEFTKLQTLHMFSIAYNQLTELPSFFSLLSNLNSLDIDHNPLTSISLLASMSISDLVMSDVSFNTLSLHEFVTLTRLRIFGGSIKQVNELPPIKTLYIENIGLKKIESIPECNELSLQTNGLTSIPAVNSAIEVLNLKDNLLTQLPDMYPTLQRLDVTKNLLSELPQLHTSLRFLSISCNNFDSFPNNITQLIHLHYLDLSNNKVISIPSSICNLVELEQLRMSFNYICSLPNELSMLSHLRLLNISHNRLYQLPPYLPFSLRTLLINSNHLICLPSIIKNIHLIEIDISCNQLVSIDYLTAIHSLQSINCSYNDIQTIPKEVFEHKKLERLTVCGKRCSGINKLKKNTVVLMTTKTNNGLYSLPVKRSTITTIKRNDNKSKLIHPCNTICSFGISEWKGNRETMEDCLCVIENLIEHGNHLIVLCDGHGGSETSFYCVSRFKETIEKIFIQKPEVGISNILIQTFLELNKNINICGIKDGSTCLCIFICDKKLYIANTGDCKCLLIKQDGFIQLTVEHRPVIKSEYKRIRENGGYVINDRTNGILALSRSLGDTSIQPILTPTPDIFIREREESDQFLIVACDGVWDFLRNEEVYSIVKKRINSEPSDISSSIRDMAFARGSTDNVSCVVCKF
ncbi:leucine rich repeat / protein phosphatase 2C domain containing protein [Entamoeba histolytica HM-1:IMSS-B]|uniref:Leucine rich repeat / protein phosphatase 2C domain containing protein n=6 Tax=Entamoeba histolytica TaxID=5759 RepID=C4M4H7_ENTH1|nr:leucine rich repeat / protein phosphatase 2C domain containing protein [Entamoeba histolytica HM-1:IMSS]EMD43839.1 podocan precursor, putative [Entamoeba histolytica KU27]EMH72915.1 leucine rich repeat / protein phosphatase 2C domain containing protein [Entamoeba histolytica HM-1:IMSS-B]ENY65063.1 podocan precursor, putative [Entamoeba histolytica HM-1:IMSS-A]GAT96276.1 leucine rich repeat protein phosphatase 2c domain containing protein [Entamoeba histolytica]EAL51152.2 leucine rich repeat|eukprot:XP_656538.2 leucine rich repeat / protein phosphatase 2C domain containing protein [Entamoeba histolytica HM-1:IMSS]